MKSREWLTSVLAGVILGVAGLITGVSPHFFAALSARAQSPTDAVLSTILTSHTRWHTVQGEAKFIWYSDDGSTQTYINKFDLSQPDHVYVEVIDQTGLGVDGIWISDGANIYDLNKRNKTYTQGAFRNSLKDASNLPTNLSEIVPTQ